MNSYDVIVVGGGPTGLACAIEAKRRGLTHLVLEKGCVVNSLYRYPVNMVFFTTPELLEIGELPLVCQREKPTRLEALKYYRLAARHFELNVHQYERVEKIQGSDGAFEFSTRDRLGVAQRYRSKKTILATGYYDLPNRMGIPGEDLPKVSHYYSEAHPYYDCDVAVIGGKNSAAETALDLYRHGARVTLIHRTEALSDRIKYWVRPDIANRIRKGEIQAFFNTQVTEILPDCIRLVPAEGANGKGTAKGTNDKEKGQTLKNDFVLALTGYHPDMEFIRSAGVEMEPTRMRPRCHPETLESNVAGLYLAGVIIAGLETAEIFIENGRFHGKQIVADIAAKLQSRSAPSG